MAERVKSKYRPEMDRTLREWVAHLARKRTINVGILSYNKSAPKISIYRPQENFRKLGRLTAEESMALIPALAEAGTELVTAERTPTVLNALTDLNHALDNLRIALKLPSHPDCPKPVIAEEVEEEAPKEVEEEKPATPRRRRGMLSGIKG